MRKIILSNMLSLDGYLAAPGGDLSWHKVDTDFLAYAVDLLNSADTLLFGRITYEMMAAYWPTEPVIKNDEVIAGKMNSLEKIVFSKTIEKADWENTKLFKGDIGKNITRLKQQAGKDIIIFGSGTIVSALTELNLIDEFRFIINPVILGGGTPQFAGNLSRKNLKLIDFKKFRSGVVLLNYNLLT